MQGHLAKSAVTSISCESSTSVIHWTFHGFLGATELGLLIKLILVDEKCVHSAEDDLRLIEEVLFPYPVRCCIQVMAQPRPLFEVSTSLWWWQGVRRWPMTLLLERLRSRNLWLLDRSMVTSAKLAALCTDAVFEIGNISIWENGSDLLGRPARRPS